MISFFGRGVAVAALETAALAQPGPAIEGPRAVPAPEWEAIFQRTDGWTGGDGAGTVVVGERVVWLFADSWVGPVVEGRHGPGSTIVRNAIAVHALPARGSGTPPSAADVTFYWGPAGADGKPTSWLSSKNPGEWFWPAGGAFYDVDRDCRGYLTMFLVRMGPADPPREDIWNFRGLGTSVAVVTNAQADPAGWTIAITDLPHTLSGQDTGRTIAWGAAACLMPRCTVTPVTVYGVDSTESLNMRLLFGATYSGHAHDAKAWLFMKGEDLCEIASDATPIAEHIPTEFSVSQVRLRGRDWCVMIHSEPVFGAQILCRVAESHFGPWSGPLPVYACPETARDKRLFVYGAKAHPELSREGELLVTYCVNSHDFWHMAGDADIYRPRFVRVPLGLIEAAIPREPAEAVPGPAEGRSTPHQRAPVRSPR